VENDPWLERWLPLIGARIGESPILELGCGAGRDAIVLARAGHRVVGLDASSAAIDEAKARVPSGEFHCQDLRAPFPDACTATGVVLASLSLHYFSWTETVLLVQRIRDVLRPSGVLLCRLNSTEDVNHGASGHPEIEHHHYLVRGQAKRFFDRADVEQLFAVGWNVLHVEHRIVPRYRLPKALWEVVLEKVDATR
jgi:SAM-dependent methyltransferase